MQITVLMATYNGAAFLAQQLHSIANQTHLPARLIISDDGSTDETRQIAQRFCNTAPFGVSLINGPCKGVAKNMLSLQSQIINSAVAYGDQDDVWLPDKLARANEALSKNPSHIPAIYTARRIITDANLNWLKTSPPLRRKAGFKNALVQNIAPANTIALNPAALSLAQSAAADIESCDLPFHDWWLYQLITGAGGQVIFDDAPVILYRQHSTNLLGGRGRIKRLKMLFDGSYGKWINAQASALQKSILRLSPKAQKELTQFLSTDSKPKTYRQSTLEQALFKLAAISGRL